MHFSQSQSDSSWPHGPVEDLRKMCGRGLGGVDGSRQHQGESLGGNEKKAQTEAICQGKRRLSIGLQRNVLWSCVFMWVLSTLFGSLEASHGVVRLDRELAEAGTNVSYLDQRIQLAAFQALAHPKTGKVYQATLPVDLANVTVLAVRLRTGSLRRRGVTLGNFTIPPGLVLEGVSLRSVVLVYRDFGNMVVYSSPLSGQALVSPVLGIMVYSASNLSSATPLPRLSVNATEQPISVTIPQNSQLALNPPSLCVSFNDDGTATTSNVSLSPNICSARHLGDFALLGQAPAPSPSPLVAPGFSPSGEPSSPSVGGAPARKTSKHHSNAWKVALGTVLGVVGLVAISSILALFAVRYRERKRFAKMQYHADNGETLQTALIGHSRAPAAAARGRDPPWRTTT